MKLLSAILDMALLPIAVASDIIIPPFVVNADKSDTRKQIEKIEKHLGMD